jgi:peptide/nickel transport system substrate-binding protein/oligopeptide transport system substrate-binding protein
MRRFLIYSLLLVLACGDGSRSSTLQYYFTYDPRSLDPALSTDVPTGEVIALLFDNLTQFNVDGGLDPGLAERWETDTTGTVYTFHLRTNARFHDGSRVTSHQVKQTFLRALDPATKGGRAWPLFPIAGARPYANGEATEVSGITTPDDSTVVLRLDAPLNVFPKLLAMPVTAITPAPLPADFAQHPIGSGPWTFVSWAHDDAIVLARNDSYWGKPAASDSIRIRIIPEALTQAAEYESKQLSVVEIPFGESRRWETEHGGEILKRPAIRDVYIAINTTRGPLRDVRVRQALNHAVDMPTILRTVIGGRGIQAAGSLPPGILGYDSTRAPYGHDLAKAKQLLREAGYANGFSLKLWRTAREQYSRIAQALQQQLGEVGIKVEIVERDASSARSAARAGETDLFLTDWYADYPDPENFNYPLFFSGSKGPGGNYAFLQDPALDSLILRARATLDENEKATLSRQIDQRVFDTAPWIFCYFPVDWWARQPEVSGWEIPAIFNGQRWTEAKLTR